MSEIIRLKHIYKRFEGIETLDVLEDINLSIKKGEFISISGRSGIGKSTLLHIIGTLLHPSSGEMFFYDKNLSDYTHSELNFLRAKKIASVFQEFSFIQALNIVDNLKLAYRLGHPEKKKPSEQQFLQKRIDELFDFLELGDKRFYLPSQLSGCQKRRAMMICALLKEPELMLCDEPTNDLDESMSKKVIQLLDCFVKGGGSVVLVSHNKEVTESASVMYTIEGKMLKRLNKKG